MNVVKVREFLRTGLGRLSTCGSIAVIETTAAKSVDKLLRMRLVCRVPNLSPSRE
jgi:hypothetical protein